MNKLNKLTPQEKADIIKKSAECIERAKADHGPQDTIKLMVDYLNWVKAEL